VQAGSWGGYGASLVGEDSLIALAILLHVVAPNVGRQWHVADAVEDGEEIVDRRELEETFAELAAFEDFGFKQDFAGWRGKDKALTDGDLAAWADEDAPEVCLSWFGGGFGEHDFNAAGWFFTTPTARTRRRGPRSLVVAKESSASVEARWNHAAVVKD
jgi:hypothetical protein